MIVSLETYQKLWLYVETLREKFTMPVEDMRQEKSLSPLDISKIIGLETYQTWQYVDELKNPRREKSPSNPEHLPVTRGRPTTSIEVSRQEESPSTPKSPKKPGVCVGHFGSEPENSSIKKRKTEIPIDEQSGLEQSPMDEKPAIDAEASTQEKSPPKPEKSPITRGKSGKAVAASRQEKSPSKPQRSPIVTRGRSTKKAVAASRQEKCPSKPEKSQLVTRGNSTKSVEAFDDNLSTFLLDQKDKKVLKEKCSSASCTGSIKRVTPKISRPPGSGTITTGEIHNEEGRLRIKPSVTKKRHGSSSVKTSEKDISQTRSDLFQFEKDSSVLSSKRSPVKRKSIMAINHPSPFGPEASIIESPKKITQVIEDQCNHSRQTKSSAKAKNKRAAPVDNYEVQSDLGENSLPIVERKENKMTASGKNNRQPRSEKSLKRTISHTHDKQSKD
ncbi:hypothetical protein TNCT_324461 [Trichonephila clavata]|uniref:Uncharacterized protein n=1 Tax=Trichonephila clavata TaxID=2740835 RepID=A0A8X6H3B2_TRICU|nr:hypothetical protein TNCT_324461 [Trichonephila clavata]